MSICNIYNEFETSFTAGINFSLNNLEFIDSVDDYDFFNTFYLDEIPELLPILPILPNTELQSQIQNISSNDLNIKKRKPKIPVPEHLKDEKYWAKRKKNNEAARQNRLKQNKKKTKSQILQYKYINEEFKNEEFIFKKYLLNKCKSNSAKYKELENKKKFLSLQNLNLKQVILELSNKKQSLINLIKNQPYI
jgi:hypothetical protein